MPKRIDLGFDVVTVRYISEAEMRVEAEIGPDELPPWGLWVDEDKTIYVLSRLGLREAKKTLLHELGHAAWDLYNEHE